MVALKREKMACQRSMTQKKEKMGVVMSQKKETRDDSREKAITSSSKPHPSIHPSTHTPAPFDRDCMTCFSMDPLFDFTIYGMQVCSVLTLPWVPQKLYIYSSRKD